MQQSAYMRDQHGIRLRFVKHGSLCCRATAASSEERCLPVKINTGVAGKDGNNVSPVRAKPVESGSDTSRITASTCLVARMWSAPSTVLALYGVYPTSANVAHSVV